MQASIAHETSTARRQAMDRCLAAALMLAAVVQLIAGLLHPEDSPAGMVQASWVPLHLTFFFTLFVTLLAVIRIYGSIASRGGWLAAIAIVLFAYGLVGFEGVMLLEFGVFPQLAASDATRGLLDESGPLFVAMLGPWLMTTAVVFSIGGILFALSLIRDGGWPRWSSALLFVSPVVALSPPLPLWAWQAGLVVFSIGLADLGRTLWLRAGDSRS